MLVSSLGTHEVKRDMNRGATVIRSSQRGHGHFAGAAAMVSTEVDKPDPTGCSRASQPAPVSCVTRDSSQVNALHRMGAPCSGTCSDVLPAPHMFTADPFSPLRLVPHEPKPPTGQTLPSPGDECVCLCMQHMATLVGELEKVMTLLLTDAANAARALALELATIRWHQRLGHASFKTIAQLVGNGVLGLEKLGKTAALRLVGREDKCDACATANLKRAPYGLSDSRAAQPGDLFHNPLRSDGTIGLEP
ncbi:hypothetical protein A4X06_0g5754 [Tilletia controversa]|uniref:GAG-pre-integrase domain-containing protein n=1 Tax=Tilletia controversa TaxID=13291 RepID=A0A8X7MQS5_9BASI|nr:hypothetical protein A4X06_0g5754 [Tilletia controversa]